MTYANHVCHGRNAAVRRLQTSAFAACPGGCGNFFALSDYAAGSLDTGNAIPHAAGSFRWNGFGKLAEQHLTL